ncbi:MAG: c-type cytochrome [Solirubrobacteraceae bacterium]|nr:c-type cytochrome [Solirubrobacteraceae bacterium]
MLTILAMGWLTWEGAIAGSPTNIEDETPERIIAAGGTTLEQYEFGKQVVPSSGCLACHKIGHNGGNLGPNLSHIGDRLPAAGIAQTLRNPTAPMPSYSSLPQNQLDAMVAFLSELKEEDGH